MHPRYFGAVNPGPQIQRMNASWPESLRHVVRNPCLGTTVDVKLTRLGALGCISASRS